MLKVTIKFTVYCMFLVFAACSANSEEATDKDTERIADAASEAKIDSVNALITRQCDSLLQFKVPELADSLLKNDSLKITHIININYFDNDKKAEKVIRQLKIDCDSNLLKETYKKLRQLQITKPKQRTKAKV